MNENVLRLSGNKHFVPADHRFAVFSDNLVWALAEVSLQGLVVLQSAGLLELLNLRIGVPLLSVHLVAANVKIMVREELGHFSHELIEKLISLLVRRVHCRIKDSPLALDLVRARPAGQLGMTRKPSRAVSRHVELRHHANPAVVRIANEITDFVLRIIETIRAHGM